MILIHIFEERLDAESRLSSGILFCQESQVWGLSSYPVLPNLSGP